MNIDYQSSDKTGQGKTITFTYIGQQFIEGGSVNVVISDIDIPPQIG